MMAANLVRLYTEQISTYLKKIKISGIRVSPRIEHQNISEFAGSLNYAEIGISDDRVAFLLSSGNAFFDGQRIRTLIVSESAEGSVYMNDNSAAADFFYIFEDNTIKPIQLSEPLPLDGVNSFDLNILKHLPENLRINGSYLTDLLDSKTQTKELMEKYGKNVPRYQVVEPNLFESIPAQIQKFFQRYGIPVFVIKPASGCCGDGIKMAQMKDIDAAANHISKLYAEGVQRVYIDERIYPKRWMLQGKLQDWNIRAFIALGGEPEWIDALVRHGEMLDDPWDQPPINISKGSQYALLGTVAEKTGTSIDQVVDFSLEIAKVIQNECKAKGETPRGYIGLDIIVSQELCLIEGNGSHSGGFDELCILRGKPLESVSTKLLPKLGPFLRKNHKSHSSLTYIRLYEATGGTFSMLGGICVMDSPYQSVLAYRTAIKKGFRTKYTYIGLAIALEKLGRNKEALQTAKKSYKLDSTDALIIETLISIYFNMQKYNEVLSLAPKLGILDSNTIETHTVVAKSLAETNQTKRALMYYNKILQLDPYNEHAHFDLGEMFFKENHYVDAFSHFNASVKKLPNSLATKARQIEISRRYSEAIDYYTSALKENPDGTKLRTESDTIIELFNSFCQNARKA